MTVSGHAHDVPPPPPVTVTQHLYLARYIASDALGGFSTVGLGAHDRRLEEGERGPSIPDIGIGVIVTSTSWQPDLTAGGVLVELVEPSGRTTALNDIDGATAFGEGTPGEPYRVAFAIQHHDVRTGGTGRHRLRVTTTLAGAREQDAQTIMSEVDLLVHPATADQPDDPPPTVPGSLGYL